MAPAVSDQLAAEDVVVTLSHEGYVKRIPMHLYRRRVGSGKALAGMERYEDDYLEQVFVARTQGWVLAFTEKGHLPSRPAIRSTIFKSTDGATLQAVGRRSMPFIASSTRHRDVWVSAMFIYTVLAEDSPKSSIKGHWSVRPGARPWLPASIIDNESRKR